MGAIGGLVSGAGDAYGAVAGGVDFLAGSTDEAVARQFDDEPGGGVVDETAGAVTGTYSGAAGVLDHLAGSADEAFSRSFDSEGGGGLVDGFVGALDHLAGSTDEAVARQFDDQPGGGLGEGLFDTVAGTGDALAGPTDETFSGVLGGIGNAVGGVAGTTTETVDRAGDAVAETATDIKILAAVAILAYVVVGTDHGPDPDDFRGGS